MKKSTVADWGKQNIFLKPYRTFIFLCGQKQNLKMSATLQPSNPITLTCGRKQWGWGEGRGVADGAASRKQEAMIHG